MPSILDHPNESRSLVIRYVVTGTDHSGDCDTEEEEQIAWLMKKTFDVNIIEDTVKLDVGNPFPHNGCTSYGYRLAQKTYEVSVPLSSFCLKKIRGGEELFLEESCLTLFDWENNGCTNQMSSYCGEEAPWRNYCQKYRAVQAILYKGVNQDESKEESD